MKEGKSFHFPPKKKINRRLHITKYVVEVELRNILQVYIIMLDLASPGESPGIFRRKMIFIYVLPAG
jgi:hypothetical protein